MKDLLDNRSSEALVLHDWSSARSLYESLGGPSMTARLARDVLIEGKTLPETGDVPLARQVRAAGVTRRKLQNEEFVDICEHAASDLSSLEVGSSFAAEIEEEAKRELRNCEGFVIDRAEEAATQLQKARDALRIYNLENGEDTTAHVRLAKAKRTTIVIAVVDGLVIVGGLWTAQVSGGVVGAVALGAILSACTVSMAVLNGKVRSSILEGRS